MTAVHFLYIGDLVVQGCFFLLTFVRPWFLPLGAGSRAFGIPFLVTLLWGIWRLASFDPATKNDLPGIAYIMMPFALGIIASILYAIRSAFLRWRAAKSDLPETT